MSVSIEALMRQFDTMSLHIVPGVALSQAIGGEDVNEYLLYLERVLSGEEQKGLHQFSFEEIEATCLLLLWRFMREEKVDDLALFLRCFPYYVASLNTQDDFTTIDFTKIFGELPDKKSALQLFREQANDLIANNSGYEQDRYDVMHHLDNLESLLHKIIPEAMQPELVALSARSLLEWNRRTGPSSWDFVRMFSEVADVIRKEKSELLDSFCRLETNANLKCILAVHIKKPFALLQSAQAGGDVRGEIAYLASILFCEEAVKMSSFSFKDRQATILLLQDAWEKTGQWEYFHLMLYAIPYCIITLEIAPSQIERDLLVDSLRTWYCNDKPHEDEVVEIISLYAALLAEGKDCLNASYDLLHDLIIGVPKTKNLQWVIFKLRNIDGAQGVRGIIKQLSIRERLLLITLCNQPSFPEVNRVKYFGDLLADDALFLSQHIPSLSSSQICALLDALEKNEDEAYVRVCLRHIANGLFASSGADEIKEDLAVCPHLMQHLLSMILEHPDPVLFNIYYPAVVAASYPSEQHKQVLSKFLNPKLPDYYLLLALFLFTPSDTQEIKEWVAAIQKKQTLVDALIQIGAAEGIDPKVHDQIMTATLQEEAPESFLMATKFSGRVLSLSALAALVDRATELFAGFQAYQDEREFCQMTTTLGQAISTLFDRPWCSEVRGDATWYRALDMSYLRSEKDPRCAAMLEKLAALTLTKTPAKIKLKELIMRNTAKRTIVREDKQGREMGLSRFFVLRETVLSMAAYDPETSDESRIIVYIALHAAKKVIAQVPSKEVRKKLLPFFLLCVSEIFNKTSQGE